jgi:hypothetical protein
MMAHIWKIGLEIKRKPPSVLRSLQSQDRPDPNLPYCQALTKMSSILQLTLAFLFLPVPIWMNTSPSSCVLLLMNHVKPRREEWMSICTNFKFERDSWSIPFPDRDIIVIQHCPEKPPLCCHRLWNCFPDVYNCRIYFFLKIFYGSPGLKQAPQIPPISLLRWICLLNWKLFSLHRKNL